MQKSQNQSLELFREELKFRGVIDVKITLSEEALSHRNIDQMKDVLTDSK